ncbi:MAG: hypothetical protein ACRENK_01560, partial [Gemmatimonadaceae bacterium]
DSRSGTLAPHGAPDERHARACRSPGRGGSWRYDRIGLSVLLTQNKGTPPCYPRPRPAPGRSRKFYKGPPYNYRAFWGAPPACFAPRA